MLIRVLTFYVKYGTITIVCGIATQIIQNLLEEIHMNKADLINAFAAKNEVSKKDADAAVNGVLDLIAEALEAGDKVQLMGFGSFEVKTRAARTGKNPATGATIKIAASKAVVFKAGKALKDSVQ